MTTPGELGSRGSVLALAALLLLSVTCSVLHAISKPLWNDEIITVIVADQPSLRHIWRALADAADTNPPAFYVAARIAHWFVADDHLAHRLPSVAGLALALTCVFLFLSRRVSKLSALVGATFLLVTPLSEYAYEARPYALMIACLAAAMMFWQRLEDSSWYAPPLAVALAASVSLHYYAVLAWPAFVAAEGAVLLRRRFRLHAWSAIVAAAAPFMIFAPLLVTLREFYGENYWARTSLAQGLVVHDWLFLGQGHWGLTLTAGLSLALVYWISGRTYRLAAPVTSATSPPVVPTEEYVLVLMVLWMPAIAVTLPLVSGAGLTERHFLPATLGGALAIGLLVARLGPAIRAALLVLFMSSYLYSSHHEIGFAWKGKLLEQRRAKTADIERMVTAAPGTDGLLVVSSALEYLEAAYFAPSQIRSRLHWLADPNAAVRFSGSASPDLALLRLQHWMPLHVEDYAEFAAKHHDFVLVGGKGVFSDWWPRRFLHDGHRLQVLAFVTGRTIYRVTLQP
jgi:hypothetical protein